jgi:phosphoserine aminotransferase
METERNEKMAENVVRAYNFNAGPSALPLPVLEQAQEELVNFRNSGMSIMELSHRSALYEEVHDEAISLLKELLAIPENYEVLFLQGGASLQFSMVPMNFLSQGKQAGYVLTGSWSEKALKEAQILGRDTYVAASTKDQQYSRIPSLGDIQVAEGSSYVHITSNNTIYGSQWRQFPDTGSVPLIADMSSDILSRSIDVNQFGLIYAGAQKNLGPSGVTVVIIRRDLLDQAAKEIPTMLRYDIHAANKSLYHTPPTFGIYMLGLVLKWVKQLGGIEQIERINEEKAKLIYDQIDESNGFYKGHVSDRESRSLMNITFRLQNEALEKEFLAQAKKAGFVGLNGHRSVGGCRASTYNAVPYDTCKALADFMNEFYHQNA